MSGYIYRMMNQYPKQYLYRQIVRAKIYIDVNCSSAIDLEDIADEACFSKYHFVRLFKKIYGSTPHQYLTSVRVEMAKEYLAQGDAVAKTCFSVGFDSISSFSGLFKRRVGMTPAAYRLQEQRRRSEIGTTPLKHIPNCFAEARGWTQKSNFREAKSID